MSKYEWDRYGDLGGGHTAATLNTGDGEVMVMTVGDDSCDSICDRCDRCSLSHVAVATVATDVDIEHKIYDSCCQLFDVTCDGCECSTFPCVTIPVQNLSQPCPNLMRTTINRTSKLWKPQARDLMFRCRRHEWS